MTQAEIKALFTQMTLAEKIGQLTQLPGHFYSNDGEITGPIAELGISEEIVHQCGSTLGISGAAEVMRVQKEYLAKSRLKIPLLFMADVVHGYRTIFPIPLAMGASWNLELAQESARVAAAEADVAGVHVTFAPMVDLVRDPRWGRVMESTGEDSYLNEMFAQAMVRGFQGEHLESGRVAACVKHFAAYGAAEAGRDYNTVDMSRLMLRNQYLPAYKAAIDAGVKLIMTSFNTVEGVPATVNRWLLRDLLRKEWHFEGTVISDYTSLAEVVNHGLASDLKDVAELGLNAGLDIEMSSPSYVKYLAQLVDAGKVRLADIDEAVMRVLTLKNELGLFENPYRGANVELESKLHFSAEHQAVALAQAEESLVLLKNESNILPLSKEKKVILIGPKATARDHIGAWCWKGDKRETPTIEEALLPYFPNMKTVEATTMDEDIGIADAVAQAKDVDVIILAIGEKRSFSGEARSKADITLTDMQLRLITALKQLNKPMIALVMNGRPLDLHGVIEHVDALMVCWHAGTQAAKAIAKTLMGMSVPSGKLSMTFPHSVGQIPVYYNALNTGRPLKNFAPVVGYSEDYLSKYLDIPNAPRYPFGFGLSYTTFAYSDITLSKAAFSKGESITASLTVTNTGNFAGKEVVQLYIRDCVASVSRPVKELKGFQKIFLAVGESKELHFTINEEMLRYYHADESFSSDAGDFTLFIGTSSDDDARKIDFSLV
ncbi:glycoside hydrolase family 3 N-terminal domain-containing protein [Entomospira culicis]|uniref:Beta-glucosidase n=1 Tax=Entomospira culicis TaxID=2719989 RepID=A0A968GGH4_9SPIO|nr:glycoside hydrolase family 3 N-terminal domain-containing protein [Entomospira culicis]NIZ19177.1 beta-glucosidase [Entomospira culicis]NIZ69391.1 beta-glucosidase [Entomospira culicis]WDI36508.1 glycoside hydrolase family 3 N-terminal domain-containing protein [Entomospira culicis]WDI38134.1 glycoside hydrolase family 3 N-terminal domain-containing protein [Entomospira culicis]